MDHKSFSHSQFDMKGDEQKIKSNNNHHLHHLPPGRLQRITPKTLTQMEPLSNSIQNNNNSQNISNQQQNNNNSNNNNTEEKNYPVKFIKSNAKLQPLMNQSGSHSNNNKLSIRPKLISQQAPPNFKSKRQSSEQGVQQQGPPATYNIENSFSNSQSHREEQQMKSAEKQQLKRVKLPKKDFLSSSNKHQILGQNNHIERPTQNGMNGSSSGTGRGSLCQYEKRDVPVVTSTDLLNNKKKLTIEYLLEKSQQKELANIQVLNLKQQEILAFDLDFTLQNLQILNLSNNSLLNVFGLAKFTALKNLNLTNNFVQDLFPLKSLKQLQKLEVANNRIKSTKCFRDMKQIQYLDLQKNQIESFTENLQYLSEVSNLQELYLCDNPCTTNRYSYKYDLLWNLKLVKLDGEVLKEKDYQLSKDFNVAKKPSTIEENNNNNFNNDNNNIMANQSEILDNRLQRPSTAQTRGVRNRFFQNDEDGSLRVQELTKKLKLVEEKGEKTQEQLNVVLQEKEELIEENEGCYIEIDELYEKIQEIEANNENLQFEASCAEDLKRENQDLRRKVSAYESALIFKDSDKEDMVQQIYHLNKMEEDYKSEKNELVRKQQEMQKIIDELQEKINNQ